MQSAVGATSQPTSTRTGHKTRRGKRGGRGRSLSPRYVAENWFATPDVVGHVLPAGPSCLESSKSWGHEDLFSDPLAVSWINTSRSFHEARHAFGHDLPGQARSCGNRGKDVGTSSTAGGARMGESSPILVGRIQNCLDHMACLISNYKRRGISLSPVDMGAVEEHLRGISSLMLELQTNLVERKRSAEAAVALSGGASSARRVDAGVGGPGAAPDHPDDHRKHGRTLKEGPCKGTSPASPALHLPMDMEIMDHLAQQVGQEVGREVGQEGTSPMPGGSTTPCSLSSTDNDFEIGPGGKKKKRRGRRGSRKKKAQMQQMEGFPGFSVPPGLANDAFIQVKRLSRPPSLHLTGGEHDLSRFCLEDDDKEIHDAEGRRAQDAGAREQEALPVGSDLCCFPTGNIPPWKSGDDRNDHRRVSEMDFKGEANSDRHPDLASTHPGPGAYNSTSADRRSGSSVWGIPGSLDAGSHSSLFLPPTESFALVPNSSSNGGFAVLAKTVAPRNGGVDDCGFDQSSLAVKDTSVSSMGKSDLEILLDVSDQDHGDEHDSLTPREQPFLVNTQPLDATILYGESETTAMMASSERNSSVQVTVADASSPIIPTPPSLDGPTTGATHTIPTPSSSSANPFGTRPMSASMISSKEPVDVKVGELERSFAQLWPSRAANDRRGLKEFSRLLGVTSPWQMTTDDEERQKARVMDPQHPQRELKSGVQASAVVPIHKTAALYEPFGTRNSSETGGLVRGGDDPPDNALGENVAIPITVCGETGGTDGTRLGLGDGENGNVEGWQKVYGRSSCSAGARQEGGVMATFGLGGISKSRNGIDSVRCDNNNHDPDGCQRESGGRK